MIPGTTPTEEGDSPAAQATRHRVSLRARITMGFLLFGLLLSSGFSGVAYYSMESFEGIVVRELLHSELEQLIALRRSDSDSPLPSSPRMYARIVALRALDTLPAPLRSLHPGVHVLDEDGEHETYVAVQDAAAQRFFYFIDLGAVAEREVFVEWMLAAIIVVGTLLSGTLGLVFGGYLIVPVKRLARRVDATGPGSAPHRLALQFADDEVGALAAAFDRYQRRLASFLQREREFTADASHELRAPLSVLKAGLDVLEEDAGIGSGGRRALARMQRRAAEMGGLLDVLLYLARSESEAGHGLAPLPLWKAWDRLLSEGDGRCGAVSVELRGDRDAAVLAPPHICAVIFGQLLDQAMVQAAESALWIDIAADRIEIGPLDARSSAVEGDEQQRSDNWLGLTLVSRLCDRLGWRLALARDCTVLILQFSRDGALPPTQSCL